MNDELYFKTYTDHIPDEDLKFEDLEEESEEDDICPYMKYLAQLYSKVGLFYSWSWQEFMDTPIDVVEYLNKDIDKKLDIGTKDDGSIDAPIINYNHLAFMLTLAQAFGGGKKKR